MVVTVVFAVVLIVGLVDVYRVWHARPGVVRRTDGRWVAARSEWRRTRRS